MTDLIAMSDADLAALRVAVAKEVDARSLLAAADRLTADLAARIAAARVGRPAPPVAPAVTPTTPTSGAP